MHKNIVSCGGHNKKVNILGADARMDRRDAAFNIFEFRYEFQKADAPLQRVMPLQRDCDATETRQPCECDFRASYGSRNEVAQRSHRSRTAVVTIA